MPTIVNTEGNRFISFAIGDEHALWYQESDDTFSWGDWKTLGGNLLQIVIMRSKIVGVEVFAIDRSSHELLRIWRGSGNWSGWNSIGGEPLKQIAVSQSRAVGVEVFGLTKSNGSLVRIWENTGTWSLWTYDLGGVALRRIATARQPNGCIQVFALGGDDRLYRIQENLGPPIHWGTWQQVVIGNPFDDRDTESAVSPSKNYEPKAAPLSIDFVPVEQPATSDDSELESDSERAKRLYKQCMWGYIRGATAVTGGAAAIARGQVALVAVAIVGGVAAIKSAEVSCEEANEVAQSTSSSTGGPAANQDGGIHGTDTYGNGPVRAGADTWYL
ncbi:MAG: hypothetical protein NTV29_09245 [Planctomycetota bacterium]|nr:hypothetical protein [Planctomycetota bacterium]